MMKHRPFPLGQLVALEQHKRRTDHRTLDTEQPRNLFGHRRLARTQIARQRHQRRTLPVTMLDDMSDHHLSNLRNIFLRKNLFHTIRIAHQYFTGIAV